MKLMNILKEMKYNEHFLDRVKNRIFGNKTYDVVIRYWNNLQRKHVFEDIGEYTIPDDVFNKMNNDYEYLKKVISQSLTKFNIIVKLHTFNLLNEWDKFILDPNLEDDDIEEIKTGVKEGYIDLRIRDKKTKSNGQTVIVIIRNNFITSTMLSYEKTDEDIERRHGKGDNFIVLDNPHDIEKYINLSPL